MGWPADPAFLRSVLDAIPWPLLVRQSVGEACRRGVTVQLPQRMQLEGPSGVRDLYVLVTAASLPRAGEPRALLIFQDIGDLVMAQGLIPVCMHCRRVRDGARGWGPMESCLKEHLDLEVSHGLCPDCLKEHYPDFAEEEAGGASGSSEAAKRVNP